MIFRVTPGRFTAFHNCLLHSDRRLALQKTNCARGFRLAETASDGLTSLRRSSLFLPNKLHSELNLARVHHGRLQGAGSACMASVGIENHVGVYRGLEAGAIEYVEELGPELNVEFLRDSFDRNVFEK